MRRHLPGCGHPDPQREAACCTDPPGDRWDVIRIELAEWARRHERQQAEQPTEPEAAA